LESEISEIGSRKFWKVGVGYFTSDSATLVPNCLQKVNSWSCSSLLWHPRRLSCDCLSNSCRPLVLNSGSENRIWLADTLCAALSSLL